MLLEVSSVVDNEDVDGCCDGVVVPAAAETTVVVFVAAAAAAAVADVRVVGRCRDVPFVTD